MNIKLFFAIMIYRKIEKFTTKNFMNQLFMSDTKSNQVKSNLVVIINIFKTKNY